VEEQPSCGRAAWLWGSSLVVGLVVEEQPGYGEQPGCGRAA